MNKEIKSILNRLNKLEASVFSGGKDEFTKAPKAFSGATGGINFLISKDFFSKKKTTSAVREALEIHDYHYQISVVQTALNRMAVKEGPLTAFKENGKKVYVKRK